MPLVLIHFACPVALEELAPDMLHVHGHDFRPVTMNADFLAMVERRFIEGCVEDFLSLRRFLVQLCGC